MAKRQRIYRAHPSASFGDNEAQWIGGVIEKYGGDFTKQQLVDESASPKSPGHKLFEWDDVIGGQLYRLHQAANHLRMVHIEIVHEGNKQPMRACFPVFHDDREAGAKRSYMSYDRIKEMPDLARQVIEKAAHELKAWQRRYALYQSGVLGPVFNTIEELENELWPQQKQSTASQKTATRRKKKSAKWRRPRKRK